jgi:hypothetical protein
MGNVLAAARELLHQRHYDDVVEACQTALDIVPNHVGLRLLLAESLMSMRRDAEAQAEVATALKVSPACPDAFRLLGALAFRRDELRAAEVFLREALRVAPDDLSSSRLLEKVRLRKPPAAAAAKLPAASAAAGTSSHPSVTPSASASAALARVEPPRRRALGTESQPVGRAVSARTERNVPEPVTARGSSRMRKPVAAAEKTTLDPTPTGSYVVDMSFEALDTEDHPLTTIDAIAPDDGRTNELPRLAEAARGALPRKQPWVRPETYHGDKTNGRGVRAAGQDSVALRLGSGNVGFGEYLVVTGVLSRWQLYRVLQVQDWKHMRVGEAAVELGYVSARRLDELLRSYEATLDFHPGEHEADTIG